MIDPTAAQEFLAQRRIALVGASTDPRQFAVTIARALRDHGIDVVPVNPHHNEVDGVPCHPDLAAVPGPLDGVLVMVGANAALAVVRSAIARGVTRVWLFRGLGGPGAMSDEAVALCEEHGVDVVAGACPLMFLEPVGVPHRVHRAFRRLNGSLARA